jgi:site-specific DNA recombinase
MTTLTAGIYCRISEDAKGLGLGVARQEKDCRELAARIGAEVAGVYVDNDVSAYSGRARPRYAELLAAIEARQINALIVWHPDRLHRSPRELEDFVELVERTGCEVRTVTAGDLDLATPEGRLVARITGAVARKESEDKARRSRRKHQELRESGKPSGRLGYPYGEGATLIPERVKIIHEIADRILAGESCGMICRDFNARGVPTRNGGRWSSNTIRSTITSPSLVSLVCYRGEILGVGTWPPAMDRLKWERVCAAAQGGKHPNRRPRSAYLLSNIAKCGNCGRFLTGRSVHRNGGLEWSLACFKEHGGCGRVHIRTHYLDEMVETAIRTTMDDEPVAAEDDAEEVAEKIAATEAKLVDFAMMHEAGEITKPEFLAMRSAAAARLDALVESQRTPTVGAGGVAGEVWAEMTIARKRELIAAHLEVIVDPAVKQGRFFDPSRVRLRWLQ